MEATSADEVDMHGDKRFQPSAWLPGAGLATCVVVALWVWYSERGDQPLFHLGISLTLLVTFGLVWLFGIRYGDVGWMVVITAVLTLQSAAAPVGAFEHHHHVATAVTSFALMLAFGGFLHSFFRVYVRPGRVELAYVASVLVYGAICWLLPPELFFAAGMAGALEGYVGAAILAGALVYGLRAVGPWPRKRRRYVLLVLAASGAGALAFFVQARWGILTPARLTPFLNYLFATVFALLLLADLVIFHRNYFKEKASRVAQDHERIKAETRLALGRSIQELMIGKDRAGTFHDFSYEFTFQPAAAMGGDWLFAWDVKGGEKRLLFGKATGGGPQGPLGVAAIISVLHDCTRRELTLPDVCRHLNARLLDVFERQLTSTLMAVSIGADGSAEVLNCGGLGYFLVSREGLAYGSLNSTPLGVTEDLDVAHEVLALEEGDVLFAVTDGAIADAAALRRIIDWFDEEPDVPRDIATIRSRVLALAGPSREQSAQGYDRTMLAVKRSA